MVILAIGILVVLGIGFYLGNRNYQAMNNTVKDMGRLLTAANEGRLSQRIDTSRYRGGHRRLVENVNHIMDAVEQPFNAVAAQIAKIANGEDLEELKNTYQGCYAELIDNLNQVRASLYILLNESERLLKYSAAGDLSQRGDESQLKGGFANIIHGINGMLDMIVEPLNEARQVINRMAMNDFTLEVTGKYRGMLKEFGDEINTVRSRLLSVQDTFVRLSIGDCSRLEEFQRIGKRSDNDQIMPAATAVMQAIRDLIQEVSVLATGAVQGNLESRGNPAKFAGGYREIIIGFNNTLDAMVNPLKEALVVIGKFAVNDYSTEMSTDYNGAFKQLADAVNTLLKRLKNILRVLDNASNGDTTDLETLKAGGKRSDNDQMVPAFVHLMETIQNLIMETGMLTDAALEGKLDVRGNAAKFKGGYCDIVMGINKTLDVVIAPLNEAGQVLSKMAVNDYTSEITGSYKGMLGEFTQQINTVRMRLLSIQDAFIRLAKGDNSRLEEFQKVGKRSENDRMMPSATAMMQAIQNLITEAGFLVEAAAKGQLEIRSDVTKFEGAYHDIINGFNMALDAIATPINEASAVLQEMAKGDLRVGMKGDYDGSYAVIKNSLNQTVHSLNAILGGISEAADQVAASSKQVSDGSQALSQGATEQASSLEELTSSITEVAAQTKQNAMNANHANDLAQKAQQDAEQGNVRMAEMLKSMDGINESSANISKIIKVIDEIAFQTNILALNAAVEAARAGQYGKGFAVVAEEVRNLAARSADAAKETTVLIEGSIKKVESGAKIANDTAQALQKIVGGISEAAQLVNAIAAASNEQATGITQINMGIEQVSEVVQTNTATSEESAAASEELSGQAGMLKEMVNRFKLDQEGTEQSLPAYHSGMTKTQGKTLKRAQNTQINMAALHGSAGKLTLTGGEFTSSGFGKY